MACTFLGRWPAEKGPQYGALDTYLLTVPWLANGASDLHDWGCGAMFAKHFCPSTVKYVGVDGTAPADEIENLARRTTTCDSILLRHILENNAEDWQEILAHALAAFRHRMAIVNFKPFSERTVTVIVEELAGFSIPYVQFAKSDIDKVVERFIVGETTFHTRTHTEHIWYLEKR